MYAKMSYQFLMPIGYTNTKVSLGHKLCTGTNKFDTTLKHPRYAIGAHWIYASGEVWGEGIDPGCSLHGGPHSIKYLKYMERIRILMLHVHGVVALCLRKCRSVGM